MSIYHWLTNKAYLSDITIANIYQFLPTNGDKNQLVQIQNKITSLSPYTYEKYAQIVMGQICRSPWQTSWNILPPKHAHTNTCTNRRTNRKHNASNPIYWIGRGMKSKEIQSFSTLNQSAISKLQNRLLTQRVWPRRPTQPPTFKEKEKRKKIGQSGLRDGKIGTSTSLNLTPAMVLTSQTFPYIITTRDVKTVYFSKPVTGLPKPVFTGYQLPKGLLWAG